MIVFNTDLDNTMIYSYKHDIGNAKRCVEIYHDREISFVTERTYELLQQVNKEMLIVPITTRTIEQYKRIDLGIGSFKYALVCNGGVLLVDGKKDENWYRESLELISESKYSMEQALKILENDNRRKFELRFVEELFVFTKCEQPDMVVADLKEQLDTRLVDVFHNGDKVYVVPVKLNKGAALERLRNILRPEFVIAAGDSEFDISMVTMADKGVVPVDFKKLYGINADIIESRQECIFSEFVLEMCIKIKAEHC